MKATFKDATMIADKEFYDKILSKYKHEPDDDRGRGEKIYFNHMYASQLFAKKVDGGYSILPLSADRMPVRMESYWTLIKTFNPKVYAPLPQYYRQWFENRGIEINEESEGKIKLKDFIPEPNRWHPYRLP